MKHPACPRCGLPVIPLQAASPRSPSKVYCSARCQKAAEKSRWQRRRRTTLKETTR